jgi:LuxR family maltose regulon positive regulatory protein
MRVPVLTTKLNIPLMRDDVVLRPALIQQLNEGLRLGHKLILLSAPAGYGKTTLLGAWFSSLESMLETAPSESLPTRISWFSLDEGDNDPVRFLVCLITALQNAVPGIGQETLESMQNVSPQAINTQSVLTVCINQIATLGYRILLVLDDYHVISSSEVHAAIAFLLDNLPNNVHLVIATRVDPPLQVARLRGRSLLTELRQADLKFTHNEIAAFMKQVMGLNLSCESVSVLASRTEGWITGLQMAALVMKKTDELLICDFLDNLSGRHEHIVDYFVDEVLNRQSTMVKSFLLQTSILSRMTGSLCDAICSDPEDELDHEKGQRILEYLQEANIFVVPLDHERLWYRYHRLFADLLRQRLVQTQSERIPALHLRASRWFEHNGFTREAIAHAILGGDFPRAAHLIENIAEGILMHGEFVTLATWFRKLPYDIAIKHPLLCLYYAVVLVLNGESPENVQEYLHIAASHDIPVPIAHGTEILHALLALWRGDVTQSITLGQKALAALPERDLLWRGVVTGNLGIAELYIGNDLKQAASLLEEAVVLGENAQNVMGAVIALCNLAELRILQGQLHTAKALYERAQTMAVDKAGKALPIHAMPDIGFAGLLHEWDELEKAEYLLREGIDLGSETLPFWGLSLDGYLIFARIKQSQGDLEAAQDAINRAREIAAGTESTVFDDLVVAATQARFWIAHGQIEAAIHWARKRGLFEGVPSVASKPGEDVFYSLYEFEHLILAEIWIAQNEASRALDELHTLLEQAERHQRVDTLIKASILIALAYHRINRQDKALIALERALVAARPGGYVRSFTEWGSPMIHLLHQGLAQGICVDDIRRLISSTQVTKFPESESREFVEPLSERELAVLRLLAAHLTNTVIGQELYISVNTVRYHLKNIYSKLQVHSRKEAVQRAEELELL